MPADQQRLILRILSGPHSGGEMLLVDGRHLIGKGDQCEIILSDDQIAAEHAALVISGTQLKIEALGGAHVIVNGEAVRERSVEPLEVITLDRTHLAIGPQDEAWPDLILPTDETLRQARESADASEEAATSAEQASDTEATGEETDVPQETATSAESPADSAPATGTRRPARPLIPVLAAACGILLLLSLLAFGLVSGSGVENEPGLTLAEVQLKLNEIVGDLADGSNVQVEVDDETPIISGYVPTDQAFAALDEAVDAIPMRVTNGVRSTERLARQAQQMLDRSKLDFQAEPGGPGEVVVTGDAESEDVWPQIERAINRGVRRIATLTDSLSYPGRSVPEAPEAAPSESTGPASPQLIVTQAPMARATTTGTILVPTLTPRGPASSPAQPLTEPSPEAQTPIGSQRPDELPGDQPVESGEPPPPSPFDGAGPVYSLLVQSVSVGDTKSVVVNDERVFTGGMLHLGADDAVGHVVKTIGFDEATETFYVTLVQDGEEFVATIGAY